MHKAVDISRKGETYIYSSRSGIVSKIYDDHYMGVTIEIQHADAITKYSHLEKAFVKVGDIIGTDKVIGKMGNTGELSEGRHLHYELWVLITGKYILVNPILEQKKPKNYWQ